MNQSTGSEVKRDKWYSLYDKVYAPANLALAWEQVAENRGAAGVDGVTIAKFKVNSTERLQALSCDLRAKTYRPAPVRRVYIPKADGGKRPLGIPTVRDRIVQQALLQILSPIFEPEFKKSSHGFRPGLGCHSALKVVDQAVRHGYEWVVDVDIKGFFDNVDHELLLAAVNVKVSDGSVLRLIRQILQAGVIEPDTWALEPTEVGTPQGGPLSPLLANIYLHRLDEALEGRYGLVRYADDLVVFTRGEAEANAALGLVRSVLEGELKLCLHPEKTRVSAVDAGFEFLGFQWARAKNGRMYKRVRRKSRQRFRDRVRELTPRIKNQRKPKKRSFRVSHLSRNPRVTEMIVKLNKYLNGWHWYFKGVWQPPETAFESFDSFVRRRLRLAITGRVRGWMNMQIPNSVFQELGLISLKERHEKYQAVKWMYSPAPARKG